MHLTLRGLSRDDLQSHLAQRYTLVGPMDVSGFQAWEILTRYTIDERELTWKRNAERG